LPFGVLAFRVTWIAAFFLSLASSSPATTQKNLLAGPSAYADMGRLSRGSDSDSRRTDSVTTAEPATAQAGAPQVTGGQPQGVVERIEFYGNRRIRSDTLKARIFSREGGKKKKGKKVEM